VVAPITSVTATGYAHPDYAASLSEFGTPRALPRSGGWILEREIPGFAYRDAMGCYPLFTCLDWAQLRGDLEAIEGQMVALSLVTDPFGDFALDDLHQCFDLVRPFKEHFVADLHQPLNQVVSKSHRYNARKALRTVCVEECLEPGQYLEEWVELYTNLVERHKITGMRAFSRASFQKQLAVPGIVMYRATAQGETVGVNLLYTQGDVAYTHLSAFSPHGYEMGAAYAVRWVAMEHLAHKVRWLSLGASSGLNDDSSSGLHMFKKGWATGTRTVYLCGRILDRDKYQEIVSARGICEEGYFPLYRRGEFR
jgi:hypothetical protein